MFNTTIISIQLFVQSAFFMVMTSLWYSKSVYMDFMLTACFYHTALILWQAWWVLWLHCSYWFCFSTWWFSGPSVVKLVQKVIPPSRYIKSRHFTTQKTNHFTFNKAGKFQTLHLSIFSSAIQGLYVVVSMLSLCICTHVYDTIDSPCSNLLTQLTW